MSDDRDRTRNSAVRGPLPRTNRPRPVHASRAAKQAGPSDSEDSSRVAESQVVTSSNTATEPDAAAATAAEGDSEDEVTASDSVPPTRREGSTGRSSDSTELGERPTQLDRKSQAPTQTELGSLKRATVTRISGSGDDGGETASTHGYVGYVIDGRYKVESILGRGGMGVVYAARHEVIDKVVAIKVLLPTEDTDVVERFVNEARAATAIGNQHIVDTIDFGELPDGSTYFVMEHLEGQTLAKRIRRDKFVQVATATHIAQQIAEGMAAAHEASIVHRDLKPENIFITTHGKDEHFVKLLDFGIAKVANAQNKITRAGSIFGTPHYMSPEQAAGTEVDRRTDIYSLGVIMYEMASGRVPFDAENPMGLLTQHMYKEPVPLTEIDEPPQSIPIGYDAVVLKCLRKKPEERYPDMAELARDLERLARGAAPAAIADLLSRADASEHPDLIRAAKAATHRTRGSRLPLVVAATGTAGVAGIIALSLLAPDSDAEQTTRTDFVPVVPKVTASAAPRDAGASAPKKKKVTLVVFPSDAKVTANGKNLGPIPVHLEVADNQPFVVQAEREGFQSQEKKIDGKQALVLLELEAIPGEAPEIPVPDMDAIERFKREALSRLRLRRDAGAKPKKSADGGKAGIEDWVLPPLPSVTPPTAPSSQPPLPIPSAVGSTGPRSSGVRELDEEEAPSE